MLQIARSLEIEYLNEEQTGLTCLSDGMVVEASPSVQRRRCRRNLQIRLPLLLHRRPPSTWFRPPPTSSSPAKCTSNRRRSRVAIATHYQIPSKNRSFDFASLGTSQAQGGKCFFLTVTTPVLWRVKKRKKMISSN